MSYNRFNFRRLSAVIDPTPPPVSQVAYLWSAQGVANDGNANLTTPQQDGDCILAIASATSASTAPANASGFTSIGTLDQSGGPSVRLAYQFRSGSDITDTGSFSGANWVAAICYRGLDQTTPFSVEPWATGTGTSIAMPVPTFPRTIDWALDVGAIGPDYTWTAALTERFANLTKRFTAADTNGAVSSLSARNVTLSASADYAATTLILRSA